MPLPLAKREQLIKEYADSSCSISLYLIVYSLAPLKLRESYDHNKLLCHNIDSNKSKKHICPFLTQVYFKYFLP